MPRHATTRLRLIAVAATTSLLASSCSMFNSDEPESAAVAERDNGVLVAVDGWSAEMMPSTLRWDLGGRKGDVRLEPATAADIDELLERDPQVVTQLAARLLTADPRLTCDKDGCTAGDAPVDLAGLTDIAAGPYGDVLEAGGVTSGVYIGFVPVEGDGIVNLDVGNDRVVVPVGTPNPEEAPLPDGTPNPEDFEWYGEFKELAEAGASDGADGGDVVAESPAEDDPLFEDGVGNPEVIGNPYQRTVVIGAGAGRMFELSAPWLTGEADEGPHPFGATDLNALLAPALDELTVPEGNGPLAAGLADVAPNVTADLSPTQLTALTSPTTGCGVGVLCSPSADGLELEQVAADTARVCDSHIVNPFSQHSTEGAAATQPAVLQMVARSQRWTVTGGPRNQFGFWENDPKAPNVLFWPAAAPAVEGEATRHVRTVELYDGQGRLVDISGEVTAEDTPWGVDRVISAHSDRFSRCDVPPAFEMPGEAMVYDEVPEFLIEP